MPPLHETLQAPVYEERNAPPRVTYEANPGRQRMGIEALAFGVSAPRVVYQVGPRGPWEGAFVVPAPRADHLIASEGPRASWAPSTAFQAEARGSRLALGGETQEDAFIVPAPRTPYQAVSAGSRVPPTRITYETRPRPSCRNCGRYATKRCGACKAPYCSRECQKQEWQHHRPRCEAQSRAIREDARISAEM